MTSLLPRTEPGLRARVALVTGAGRGIGRAIAFGLAEQGLRLALVARRSEPLEVVAEEVRKRGGEAWTFAADLADPRVPEEIIRRTVERFGRLDILVNNAASSHRARLEETTAEIFDALMAVNARAPFLLCRHAMPHLRKSDRASIINIASVAAHRGYAREAAYAASKHALLGITRVLAREAQAEGIRVHLISPGGVNTDFSRTMGADLDPSTLMAPEEIAEVVCFLLGRRSNAVIDEVRLRRAVAEPSL